MKWDELKPDDSFCTLRDDLDVPLGQVAKGGMGEWTAFDYSEAKRTRLGEFPLLEKATEAVERAQNKPSHHPTGTVNRNLTGGK